MANVFERLRDNLQGYLTGKKVEKKSSNKYEEVMTNNVEKDESSICLMEETYQKDFYRSCKEENKVSHDNLININRLPVIYLLISISAVFLLLWINHNYKISDKSIYNEVGPNKLRLVNFFHTSSINLLLFHTMNAILALIGLVIVYFVHWSLCANYHKIPQTQQMLIFKFYLIAAFGYTSQIALLVYSCLPIVPKIEIYNRIFKNETHLEINEFFFLIQILFSCLFSIFLMLVQNNQSTEVSLFEDENNYIQTDGRRRTFGYKLITTIYLIFFGLVFIFLKFFSSGVILKEMKTESFKINVSYLNTFLPYLLYFLNSILFYLFRSEIEQCQVTISPQTNSAYDKYQKNIL